MHIISRNKELESAGGEKEEHKYRNCIMNQIPNLPALSDDEWKALLLRLTRYANAKVHAKIRRLPPDMTIDDLVYESIKLALERRRIWNRESYPNVEDFLKGIIDSKISGIWALAHNASRFQEHDDVTNASLLEMHEAPDDVKKAYSDYTEGRLSELREAIKGQSELEDLLAATELACEQCDANASNVAQILGWDTGKVYRKRHELSKYL
jgi:hypothetical protein